MPVPIDPHSRDKAVFIVVCLGILFGLVLGCLSGSLVTGLWMHASPAELAK